MFDSAAFAVVELRIDLKSIAAAEGTYHHTRVPLVRTLKLYVELGPHGRRYPLLNFQISLSNAINIGSVV